MTLARKSIRWRLLLWLAGLLTVVLGALAATAYQLARVTQLNQIDEALRVRVAALLADVRQLPLPERAAAATPKTTDSARRPPPPPPGPKLPRPPAGRPRGPAPSAHGEIALSPETARLFDETDPAGYYFGVWLAADAGARLSANAAAGLMRPAPPASRGPLFVRTRDSGREAFFFTDRGDGVLAGISIQPYQAGLERLAAWLAFAVAGVLGAGLGGMSWLVGRALRPVEAIGATAERIATGNLSERIDVAEAGTELGRLAGVLNATFARLESAFLRQKNFTADAAHELRTPLTVIISEAQATLARPRPAEDYRQSLEACLEAAQQMRRLADSLLEHSRFEAGQERLQRAPLDLAAVVRTAIEQVRPLATARQIAFHADLAPAPLSADAVRLAQVAANLLTNAVEYNHPGGEIRVATRRPADAAILTVQNTGAGIATGDLPRIFDRFFRADRARAESGAHHGLGLSIARLIVEAHGGTITAQSAAGAGATFTVRLPAPGAAAVDSVPR